MHGHSKTMGKQMCWLTIWYSGRDGFTGTEDTATDRPHHVSTITMGTDKAVPIPDPDQTLQLL